MAPEEKEIGTAGPQHNSGTDPTTNTSQYLASHWRLTPHSTTTMGLIFSVVAREFCVMIGQFNPAFSSTTCVRVADVVSTAIFVIFILAEVVPEAYRKAVQAEAPNPNGELGLDGSGRRDYPLDADSIPQNHIRSWNDTLGKIEGVSYDSSGSIPTGPNTNTSRYLAHRANVFYDPPWCVRAAILLFTVWQIAILVRDLHFPERGHPFIYLASLPLYPLMKHPFVTVTRETVDEDGNPVSVQCPFIGLRAFEYVLGCDPNHGNAELTSPMGTRRVRYGYPLFRI